MKVEVKVVAKSGFGMQPVYETELEFDGKQLHDLIVALQKAINLISAKVKSDGASPLKGL